MAGPTKNDLAWARLLEAKNLDLATSRFPISLSMRELKKLGGREPRLMLSMDRRERWPAPLKEAGVIAISNSTKSVALLRGDAWFDLPPEQGAVEQFKARLPFRLATSTIGKGENAHIMRLEMSGFLASFLGAEQLIPVSSGKRMTPRFSFTIFDQQVDVQSAQYEMDGQYESAEDIVPVEMKPRHYSSCSIRQVYFPFRSLGEDTEWEKPVRPLYITYGEKDDSYIVRELGFRRVDAWDSIHQIRAQNLQIKLEDPPKRVLDLQSALIDDYRIPQADNIRRIAEYPLAVARGINRADLMADYFEFDRRQSSYYRDAVQSLGLVKIEDSLYRLTADGKRYGNLPPQKRADFLARRMSKLPVVRTILEAMEASGEQGLSSQEMPGLLINFAKEHGQPLSPVTAKRRASTLKSYLRYIGSRTGTLVVISDRFYLREDLASLDEFIER